MNRKKSYGVEAIGATVFVCQNRKMGFLAEQALMYWVDQENQKEFSKLDLPEGQQVWLYVIKELSRVITVMESHGEKKEELPQVGPVDA